MQNNTELISYDSAKEQINKEIENFLKIKRNINIIDIPKISFEKGMTQICFQIPKINEAILFSVVEIMKNHIENVRIHSFESGYYSFQGMNKNIFNSENILDNIKVAVVGLSSKFSIEISKKGNMSQEEINLSVEIFKLIYMTDSVDPVSELIKLGASVYLEKSEIDWDYIAGYEEVKHKIKESIILPLQNPAVYDSIARLTRKKFETNRPKAILFEGSPGVGKTTVARIIASEVRIPLVYLPIESIMSKWYGESSKNLAKIFDMCDELGSCILFLDEIDALAGSRDQNMFEATRRILSVLLRRLDGIDAIKSTITIAATNRKNDLDSALISRFDQTILFPLPNNKERSGIFSNYASHLNSEELDLLSEKTEGFSGRSIKDLCEYTERRWARKIISQEAAASPPPPDYYRYTISLWKNEELDSTVE